MNFRLYQMKIGNLKPNLSLRRMKEITPLYFYDAIVDIDEAPSLLIIGSTVDGLLFSKTLSCALCGHLV